MVLVVALCLPSPAVAQPSPPDWTNADTDTILAGLNSSGIQVSSSGNCYDSTSSRCTGLDGLQNDTLSGVFAFSSACNCEVVITGGTEVGHASEGDDFSHSSGNKVDFRPTTAVNDYILTQIQSGNFTTVGWRHDNTEVVPVLVDQDGNYWAYETPPGGGRHWDVCFGGCPDPTRPASSTHLGSNTDTHEQYPT